MNGIHQSNPFAAFIAQARSIQHNRPHRTRRRFNTITVDLILIRLRLPLISRKGTRGRLLGIRETPKNERLFWERKRLLGTKEASEDGGGC